jgi:hypothetical protein
VAAADSSSRHLRLVSDHFAAAAGEAGRSADQICAVLLTDAGRGTFNENTVLGDVEQNRVIAAIGNLRYTHESIPRAVRLGVWFTLMAYLALCLSNSHTLWLL